ncbi:hypothetical protein ACRN9J_21665 [Shewanella baltica]|uniref:hypothetical protein n=1 Tax=Shewanella baltica TaxID=62322 RepID=UPI003D7A5F30
MVILFLVALVLAWPTKGLSVLCFILLMTVLGIMDGKRKYREANLRRKDCLQQENISHQERDAPSDNCDGLLSTWEYNADTEFASWCFNKGKYKEFVSTVTSRAKEYSVPESFTLLLFKIEDSNSVLLAMAGGIERENGSFFAQQNFVIEKVIEWYEISLRGDFIWGDDPRFSSSDEYEHPPSWINDNARCEEFADSVIQRAKIHLVPEEFSIQIFQVESTRRALLQVAGRYERSKCSFNYQTRYATERLVKTYRATYRDQRDWIDDALPSGVDKFNALENFLSFVKAQAMLRSVPVTYTDELFRDAENLSMLLKLAWEPEFQDNKKNFLNDNSQRLKVIDKIVAMYKDHNTCSNA